MPYNGEPNISLGVQPPQINSPLQTYTGLLQLKELMQGMQLKNAQIQQTQAQNQNIQAEAAQRQKDQADQNYVQQVSQDPDVSYKLHQGDFSDLEGKIQPKTLDTLRQSQQAYMNGKLANTRTQNELASTALGQISDTVNGVQNLKNEDGTPNVEGMNSAWPGAIAHLRKLGALDNAGIPASVPIPSTITDPKQLDSWLAAIGGEKGAVDAALAQQVKQTEAGKNKAQAGQATAETALTNAKVPGAEAQSAGEQAQLPVTQATTEATLNDPGLLTPEQRQQANQAAATLANQKTITALDKQKYNLEAQKFALQFGGDAVKGWTETVKDNPDAAGEVPAELRTKVMENFRADTGLPFPKPLTGTALDQERAARNTLQRLPRIEQLMNDPDLKPSIGPILGRLGDLSQTVGTATGLTPTQAAKGQELRTLLNNTLFGEGKSILGGRLPQQLMDKLTTTSVNDKMDPDLMRGAIKATHGVVNDVLNSTYQQRFGGEAVRPGSTVSPMETQVHDGVTYQRKAGSKDPWVEVPK